MANKSASVSRALKGKSGEKNKKLRTSRQQTKNGGIKSRRAAADEIERPAPDVVLDNARLFDETQRLLKENKQRAAELALINSVQQGLARKLDFREIVDLVGEKIGEIFAVDTVSVGMYDAERDQVFNLYYVDRGQRIQLAEGPAPRPSLTALVVDSRAPLLVGTDAEGQRLGAQRVARPGEERDRNEAFLGVPILAADKVIGSVAIQSYKPHAFDQADLRLLLTLANSMSVALENARLFDETQRLLKETEQRAAELAIINSVQAGLVSKLSVREIYEVVGTEIRKVFPRFDILLGTYDPVTDMATVLYGMENNHRLPSESFKVDNTGFVGELLRTKKTLLINENMAAESKRLGSTVEGETETRKSALLIPMVVGDLVRGAVSLEDMEHEHAFSGSDVRLLETIASSMSIALESARLFDETQRLFQAEQQRAAELAIMNTIQTALASNLDFQGVIDAVGDQILEIFPGVDGGINLLDRAQNLIRILYMVEKGKRYPNAEIPLGQGLTSIVINSAKPLVLNTEVAHKSAELGAVYPGVQADPKSWLGIPIITGEDVLGSIIMQDFNHEYAFPESKVRLLQTIASSLGVALENARLFDETQRLLKETEQHATELAAINAVSQALVAETEVDPLIQLIGNQMQEIFKADIAYVALLDPQTNDINFPYQVGESFDRLKLGEGLTSKIILSGEPLLINKDIEVRRRAIGATRVGNEALSFLGVPVKSGRKVLGVLSVQSATAEGRFTMEDQRLLATIAANIGVAIEHARLFAEIQARNREITESLEQQTATSEILRVIASSPTDIQPVLDVIAESARRLCNSNLASVYRTDGRMVYEVAQTDLSADVLETAREVSSQSYPAPLAHDSTLSSRAILDRAVVHIPDMENEADLPEITRRYVQAHILRSVLFVPMIREGEAIGAIGVGKREPGPFTDAQIALMETFASQAVIAIENVRLFNELEKRNVEIGEALEQQTATSNILSIIAQNPTNVQPVLDAVAESAARLCNSYDAAIVRTDGSVYRTVAHWGPVPMHEEMLKNGGPLNRASVTGRAMLDRITIHIRDLLEEPSGEYSLSKEYYKTSQQRTMLVTPLMRESVVIGAIMIRRREVDPFSQKQVALLKVFADQAAIAIENVRLFNELQTRNREMSEALEQQTATSDVLRVIASSPTDIKPVLDVIVQHAAQLCDAMDAALYQYDGRMLDLVASNNFTPEGKEEIRRSYPRPLTREGGFSALTILDRMIYHVPDAENDPRVSELTRRFILANGHKSLLFVPMMREGSAIGALAVARRVRKSFSEKEIAILQTFADQAVIAIENVRLFNETQHLLKETEQRAAELAIINSVQEGLASKLEMQAIYNLVGDKIREIFSADVVGFSLYDQTRNLMRRPYIVDHGERYYPEAAPPSNYWTQLMQMRQPLLLHTYEELEQLLAKYGTTMEQENIAGPTHDNSFIYVPLQLGADVTGSIIIAKLAEYAFDESDVRLITTLAASMSVALENVRLFNETQHLLNETEQRAQELEIINSVQQGLASKLEMQAIYDLVGEMLEIFGTPSVGIAHLDHEQHTIAYPYLVQDGERRDTPPLSFAGWSLYMIEHKRTVIVNKGFAEFNAKIGGDFPDGVSMPKSAVYVPLLVGGVMTGLLTIADLERENAFTSDDVRLLETLASSMSVALENVRLFNEVTQRKEYFEGLFQNNPVAVVTIDTDANVVSWNPAAENLFGYSQKEAIGYNLDSLVAKSEDLQAEAIGYSEAGLNTARAITRRTRKDGSLVDVELLGVPITVAGKRVGGIAIYHDITELERARKDAIAANQAKSTFLANMSHELRTPLNAIIGFTRIVRRKSEGVLPEKQTGNLDKVLSSSEHLLNLINTVLDIAKIEAGRMDVQAANFNINALADLCISTALPLVKPNVRLEKKIAADLTMVFSDQEEIKQIILNLLSNAAKFTEAGTIELSLRRQDASLIVEVRDTGIGISPDAVARIFEEFQQADTSTTREYGGTGLGLSISRDLARLLGGDLRASSEPGQGSIFTLVIPLRYGETSDEVHPDR